MKSRADSSPGIKLQGASIESITRCATGVVVLTVFSVPSWLSVLSVVMG